MEVHVGKCRKKDLECGLFDLEIMEVHVGKCRKKDFECGLCEANFVKICDLEIMEVMSENVGKKILNVDCVKQTLSKYAP